MTVKVGPYKRGGWEVDIVLTFPGRPRIRERRKAPVPTKSAAKRWGEERERQLIQHYTNTDPSEDGEDERPDLVKKEVPTLKAFIPRYMEGYCKANRHRPSTLERKQCITRNHLIPKLGNKRLDRLTAEDVQEPQGVPGPHEARQRQHGDQAAQGDPQRRRRVEGHRRRLPRQLREPDRSCAP